MATPAPTQRRFAGSALLFLAPVLLLLALSARELVDSDTWWHLKTGELIAASRQIPRTDPFSAINAGRPWVNFEWLAQLVFYMVYRLAGPRGLVLGAMLALGAAFLAAAGAGLEWKKPLLGSALLTLSVIAASDRYLVRPEIFSYLLLGLFICILQRYCQGQFAGLIFLLPVLQILWENLHGGTWLGLAAMTAYLAGQSLLRWFPWPKAWKQAALDPVRFRRLLLAAGLVLLATLVNPWGPQTLGIIFRTQAHQFTMANIAEWQRTYTLDHPWSPAVSAYWACFGLAAAGFLLNFRRLDLDHLFLALGIGFVSLLAVRNIALFALVALPVTARNLALAAEDFRLQGRLRSLHLAKLFRPARAAAMVGLAGFCLGFTRQVVTDRYYLDQRTRVRFGWDVSSVVYPWPMLDFLARSGIQGPLFNDHDLGGFMIWRLWPQYRVFLDSRAFIYDPDYLAAYSRALHSDRGWKALSDRYQFRLAAILHLSGGVGTLLRSLSQDPDWIPVYLDESGVVFARRLPENADWIARHRLDLADPKSLTWAAPPRDQARTRLGFFSAVPDPVQVMDGAVFFLNLGRWDQAEALLKRALEIAPGNPAAGSNLASLELKRRRWTEAEAWARQALDGDPQLAEAWMNLGEALYQQQRFSESAGAYGRALRLEPDKYQALLNRGAALAQLGRYPEAGADLGKAARLQPDAPRPWCNLAYVYERTGNPRAADTWRQCLAGLIRTGAAADEISQVRARLPEEAP